MRPGTVLQKDAPIRAAAVMTSPDTMNGLPRNGHLCKAREKRGAGRYMSPSAVEPMAEMPNDPEKSVCDISTLERYRMCKGYQLISDVATLQCSARLTIPR